jgi:hypothetical protein
VPVPGCRTSVDNPDVVLSDPGGGAATSGGAGIAGGESVDVLFEHALTIAQANITVES